MKAKDHDDVIQLRILFALISKTLNCIHVRMGQKKYKAEESERRRWSGMMSSTRIPKAANPTSTELIWLHRLQTNSGKQSKEC